MGESECISLQMTKHTWSYIYVIYNLSQWLKLIRAWAIAFIIPTYQTVCVEFTTICTSTNQTQYLDSGLAKLTFDTNKQWNNSDHDTFDIFKITEMRFSTSPLYCLCCLPWSQNRGLYIYILQLLQIFQYSLNCNLWSCHCVLCTCLHVTRKPTNCLNI